jgi:hypothetical protein
MTCANLRMSGALKLENGFFILTKWRACVIHIKSKRLEIASCISKFKNSKKNKLNMILFIEDWLENWKLLKRHYTKIPLFHRPLPDQEEAPR